MRVVWILGVCQWAGVVSVLPAAAVRGGGGEVVVGGGCAGGRVRVGGAAVMLILKRRRGQGIEVGGPCTVVVLSVRGGTITLGFSGGRESAPVRRLELVAREAGGGVDASIDLPDTGIT